MPTTADERFVLYKNDTKTLDMYASHAARPTTVNKLAPTRQVRT